MSVASRLTALVDGLITALNARNAPGPSDYQMWLAAGNTGTLADYRTAMVGPDEDYAAYFNGLLTTPPRSGAASEAQAGITQFATAAEAQAAAIATKALSPLQALALLRANPLRYPTIAALGATVAAEGSIAVVDRYQYNASQIHAASTWRVANGYWVLVGNHIFVECADRANVASLAAALLTDVQQSGKIRLLTGNRIRNTIAANGDEFFFSGTWQMSNPQPLIATNAAAFTTQGGFNKVPFSMPTGRDADWDSSSNNYRAPRDGYYLFDVSIRFPDGFASGYNFGLSIVTNAESQDTRTQWNGIPPTAGSSTNRYTHRVVRMIYMTAGQTATSWIYFDSNNVSIGGGGAVLEVLPVKD